MLSSFGFNGEVARRGKTGRRAEQLEDQSIIWKIRLPSPRPRSHQNKSDEKMDRNTTDVDKPTIGGLRYMTKLLPNRENGISYLQFSCSKELYEVVLNTRAPPGHRRETVTDTATSSGTVICRRVQDPKLAHKRCHGLQVGEPCRECSRSCTYVGSNSTI